MAGNQKNFGRKEIKAPKLYAFMPTMKPMKLSGLLSSLDSFTKSKILGGKIWPFFTEQMPKAGS